MSGETAPAGEGGLAWERRVAPLAAAAAFSSGVLSVASILIPILAVGSQPGRDEEARALRLIDDNGAALLSAFGAQAAALVALALTLFFLLRVTARRRPEAPKFAYGLLVLAPLLVIVGGVLNQVDLADTAKEFVGSGPQTNARAESLIDDRSTTGGALLSGGGLALAISLVLVSLNAMRAGLLSRFMGILGIIVGGLLVLPLLPGGQGFVQLFWTVALGLLFIDRWPGGRGPAWDTGRAIPWPTAAERSGEAVEPEAEPDPGAAERPASRKRRKNRR